MGVSHRMDIAQAVFGSLSHPWTDHRLSRDTKLRLYTLSVCSSLTHYCTASALTRTVARMINGFNSRCLHVIARKEYRVLAVRKRRMRYLGHVLRLYPDRIVRRSPIATVKGGTYYPERSLFSDCELEYLQERIDTATNRSWRAKVASLT